MDKITNQQLELLIGKAVDGDKKSLETVIMSVQDLIFNLSLRMLGTFADAEDASQDIIVKVITHLSSFRKESAFSTWVYRIAVNHLKDYEEHMFANSPLSLDFYRDDIENAQIRDIPDLTQNVEVSILEEELKMSCTNVLLQCLDSESRCIFILGTMFKLDSRIAGDILGMTPEAYRKRLSRIRGKVADFLDCYCGEFGRGTCRCRDRLNYAIKNHRLDPGKLDYTAADKISEQTLFHVKDAMEDIDDLSMKFSFCKSYGSPEKMKQFIREFLDSAPFSVVKES